MSNKCTVILLVVEVIAIIFRQSNNIKGLIINGTDIKLCQLADDMTLFLRETESVGFAIKLFEEFYRYAGLKLNKCKTVAFITKGINPNIYQDNTLGIEWTSKEFKTLGAWFSSDIEDTYLLNIAEKSTKIKSILKAWTARSLTVKGKITVLKSLIVPHILQLASLVPLSQKFISDLDSLFYDFVWTKKHLVSKMILTLLHVLGGLKMVSIKQTIETAKIMWMKRLCNDINAKWKVLAFELMDLTKDQVLKWIPSGYIKKVNGTFYKSLLTIWANFVKKKPQDLNMKEFVNENLFDNQLFL